MLMALPNWVSGVLEETDVVAQGLGHLLHAVQPHQQRLGEHHLGLLTRPPAGSRPA